MFFALQTASRFNAASRPRRRTAPRSLAAPKFSKLGHAWVHALTSQFFLLKCLICVHFAFEIWFRPRVFLQHNHGYEGFGFRAWGECWGLKMHVMSTQLSTSSFCHQYFNLFANNWFIFCWGFEQPSQVQYRLPPGVPEIWSQPQTWPALRTNGSRMVWRWGRFWIPNWKLRLIFSFQVSIGVSQVFRPTGRILLQGQWAIECLMPCFLEPEPPRISYGLFSVNLPGCALRIMFLNFIPAGWETACDFFVHWHSWPGDWITPVLPSEACEC